MARGDPGEQAETEVEAAERDVEVEAELMLRLFPDQGEGATPGAFPRFFWLSVER